MARWTSLSSSNDSSWKIWGGRVLELALGASRSRRMLIGETWEISDAPDRNSVVARGKPGWRTLRG
jgi:hypothetical protein